MPEFYKPLSERGYLFTWAGSDHNEARRQMIDSFNEHPEVRKHGRRAGRTLSRAGQHKDRRHK
jgi:hypothetical protein